MRYEISGTIMQTVAIDLNRGETRNSQTASTALGTGVVATAVGGILGSMFGNG